MADDAWKRLERRVKAARGRAEQKNDVHGMRASANVNELWKLRGLLDELIDLETIRGREQGAPWHALGFSKQQAQQRYKRAVERRRRARVNSD